MSKVIRTTNQEPDHQWDNNPAPRGGEGYRTLSRGKEGARNHFLINTNESMRAILAPNTGKQTPPDFKKVMIGSWAQTTRGSGASVGTSREPLGDGPDQGGQNILSQRTCIHDFAKSIGDLNCSITSDWYKVIHDCYQLSPLSEVLERSTEQG